MEGGPETFEVRGHAVFEEFARGDEDVVVERALEPHREKSISWFPVVSVVIEKLIDVYVEKRNEDERFIDTYQRIGIDPFKERVYAANH